jgi:hypothetical protein
MHKGYKCLDVSTGGVYISRDVIFDEEKIPFSELHPNAGARLKSEIALLDPTLFHHYTYGGKPVFDHIVDNPATANETVEVTGQNAGENSMPTAAVQEEHEENQADMENVAAPTKSVSFLASASEAASIRSPVRWASSLRHTHVSPAHTPGEVGSGAGFGAADAPTTNDVPGHTAPGSTPDTTPTATAARPVTRAQQGIHRPRVYTDGTVRYGKHGFLTSSGEPHSIDDALTNPNWKHAMDLEYDAFMKNATWRLVPPMKGRNIVRCK